MVSTRSQSHEAMKAVTQDLYEALSEQRWVEARQIVQQRIPPGFCLVPSLTAVSVSAAASVTPLFLLLSCRAGIPLDLLRAVLGVIRTEEYMAPVEELGPGKERNILHVALNSAATDIARMQAFVERCPKLLFVANSDARAPIEYPATNDRVNAQEEGQENNNSESRSSDIMTMILRVYPDATKHRNEKGRNLLLHAVAMESEVPFLQVLLDADPDLLYGTDNNGWNVFHHAAGFGRVEVLQFLLSRTTTEGDGDDSSRERMLMMKTKSGCIPLHIAVISAANAQVVDALVQALPESRHVYLHGCLTSLDSLQMIKRGRELLLPENITAETIATLTRVGAIARTLMSGAGAPLPLHALMRHSEFGLPLAGALFCAAGRDELNHRDDKGDLPIHVLARQQQEANDDNDSYRCAVKVMIHLYPEGCRMPDANGRVPLELMAEAGHRLENNGGMRVLLEAHPAAAENLLRHPRATCELVSVLGQSENSNTNALHALLTGLPHLVRPNKRQRLR